MAILLTCEDVAKPPLTCSFVVPVRPGVTLLDRPDVHQMCTRRAPACRIGADYCSAKMPDRLVMVNGRWSAFSRDGRPGDDAGAAATVHGLRSHR